MRGTDASPPFVDGAFDLVFAVLAFHHFADQAEVVREAFRLLRPGGIFAVVTLEPREFGDPWYVYQFFEGAYETDLVRFLPIAELGSLLSAQRFAAVQSESVDLIDAVEHDAEVLTGYFTQKEACSQLALLTEERYEEGLRRIREHIAQECAAGRRAEFRTRHHDWMVWGLKPT